MTAKDDTPTGRPLALTPRWGTARVDLHVLLVVHSLTAATRIADVLPALNDRRVQLYCTQTSGGVFANGVDKYLQESEIRYISWEKARETEFDLTLTASLGDDLHELKSKILRIPHGNGYNKKWSQESGVRSQKSGCLRTLRQHPQTPGTPGPPLHRPLPHRTIRSSRPGLPRRPPPRFPLR